MAIKILSYKLEKVVNGVNHIRAEMCVDSADELVTSLNNNVFTQGSIAWVVTKGTLYGLSGGTWYSQGNVSTGEGE